MITETLTSVDLNYISNKIKLSPERTNTLIEEDFDKNLVIDQICLIPFPEDSILNISFELFVKITIFKFFKKSKLVINDKIFIANSIIKHYKQVKSKKFIPIKGTPNFDETQYLLTYLGIFKRFEDPEDLKFFRDKLIAGLMVAEERNIVANLSYVLKCLSDLAEDSWF